jgi:DeoR/GlpR family transcriptional regulator of sugar metabolism
MMERCRTSIVLVDSSKFNKISAHRICDITSPDYIITDDRLSPEIRERYLEAGVSLIMAEMDK